MTAVLDDGVTDQDLLSTHFDPDTEVAVASVLNEKLEFDEALLTDNVTLNCGLDVPDLDKDIHPEGLIDVDSADEDSQRYFNFSRTVMVCDPAKDSGMAILPTSKSISQLDGADNDSESDAGEDGAEEITVSHCDQSGASQDSEEILVDCITEVSGDSMGQDVMPDVASSSPVLYSSVDSVPGHQDSKADPNEMWLDHASGNFISAHDGSFLQVAHTPSSVPVTTDVKSPEPKILPKPPGGKLRILASHPPTLRSIILPQSGQHRVVKVAVPAGMSLPLSLPVNVLTASPGLAQKNNLVSTPVVMNGLESHSKAATKGRAIAIRIPHSVAKPSPASSPQVLLINRSGQILIKDPQTNTYQMPNASSQPYNQISQIAKVIHSQNLIQSPVQRIVLNPQAQASPGRPIQRIISYSNGAVPPTKVMIRTAPQQSMNLPMSIGSIIKERKSDSNVKLMNVPTPGSPMTQEQKAQSILERAMASHRELVNPNRGVPSQLQLHPYLQRFQSYTRTAPPVPPGLKTQHRPTILPHLKPQVRVKRVSSASERTAVIEPSSPGNQEELNRLVKTPLNKWSRFF